MPADFIKQNPNTRAEDLHSTTTKPAFWDGTGTVHNSGDELGLHGCTEPGDAPDNVGGLGRRLRARAGRREALMERVAGIEPAYSAWKAAALPLSYTRIP